MAEVEIPGEEPKEDADPNITKTKGMSISEQLECARRYKEDGNQLYKEKQVKLAIGKYHRCLLFVKAVEASSKKDVILHFTDREPVTLSPEVLQEIENLKTHCYNNLAVCLLQSSDCKYEKVIVYCDHVLKNSPKNVKALYRKGLAHYYLGNFETAHNIFEEAKKNLTAPDHNLNRYLELCRKKLQEYNEAEKKLYQAMFAK